MSDSSKTGIDASRSEEVGVNDEGRIRYRAARRGFRVMRTRGLEHKRREKAGVGTYVLLAADGVALFSATLSDIAGFLKAHDRAKQRQLH